MRKAMEGEDQETETTQGLLTSTEEDIENKLAPEPSTPYVQVAQ